MNVFLKVFNGMQGFCGSMPYLADLERHLAEADQLAAFKEKFEDGILKVFVPKKEAKPVVEEKKYITIEG